MLFLCDIKLTDDITRILMYCLYCADEMPTFTFLTILLIECKMVCMMETKHQKKFWIQKLSLLPGLRETAVLLKASYFLQI